MNWQHRIRAVRELWLVKRQAAPDQQLRVGRPRCRVASMPNGLRLVQGSCEPSRSMFPLGARATRLRGVPRPFRASKGIPLAAGAGEGDDETPKAQAYSFVGRAVECMQREEPRRKMPLADGTEDGRAGCGEQITAGTPGARLPPVYRFSSPAACLILFCSRPWLSSRAEP